MAAAGNAPINDSKKRAVVVSIDFGTYGTSFGFAYTSDTDKRIVVEMTWDDHEGVYFKNLTQSLYKTNGNKPMAIGFSAGARYNNFEEDEAKQHILLRRYKMDLFHNRTEIEDKVSKRKFKVVDVIGDYLSGILERILQRLNAAATSTIDTTQIKFVITIPAIWSDQSLATMKQALVKARIIKEENVSEDDCMFVLEPEAASAFCKEKALSIGLAEFEEGDVFMVVDAGGGTVDITVHSIENKKLKEETVRNGGPCGSTSIDDKFFEWLASNFEPGTIEDLLSQDPIAHHQLRVEWERLKVASQNFEQDKFIAMPDSLKKLIEDGRLLSSSSGIHKRGRLVLTPEVQKDMFKDALERIGELVEEQITNSLLTVKFILLVGGFGQCPHLLKLLQDKFVNTGQIEKVVQPAQSGTVVVSGGVLLGLDPSLIRSRRAKQTYGIEVEEVFDESRHEEERLVCRDDLFLCKGVFFPFVECGQAVDADAVVERQFDTTGGTIRISIFTSPKKKVKFVDEPAVRKLADLTIIAPPSSYSPSSKPFVIVKFQFGKIDFLVEAKNHLGTKCDTKLSFANAF